MARSALVTGATGFVGRHLVAALREAGWRVTTMSRHGPADRVGDLARMPLRGLRADVVFHLAGFSNPSASVEASREAFEANATATGRLVREVRAGRFVFASSCKVYGPSLRPHVESEPPRPRTPYAASKLCGEAFVLSAGRDAVVLRPFNHTGPGHGEAFVCPAIARQIALAEAGRGPRVIRVGAVDPRLDLFDVRDMVKAYLLAARKGRAGETYNVATGRPVSVGRLAEILVSNATVPLEIRGPRGSASLTTGDASKFRTATGWRPRIPIDRTLRDLLEYERARVRA